MGKLWGNCRLASVVGSVNGKLEVNWRLESPVGGFTGKVEGIWRLASVVDVASVLLKLVFSARSSTSSDRGKTPIEPTFSSIGAYVETMSLAE